MKLQVLGVKRISGTAKTGNAFDMCQLFAMVPIEAGSGGKVSVVGAGYELAEINLEAEALPQFMGLKFPVVLELETDSKPFRGRFETVVTGFKAPMAAARAAG